MMHRLRRYDVFRFAQNDVARFTRNDAMFATMCRQAHIIRRSRHHRATPFNICRRQTSFKQRTFVGRQKRVFCWPTLRGSNSQPSESESDALSSCAKGGYKVPKDRHLFFYSVSEGITTGISHKS